MEPQTVAAVKNEEAAPSDSPKTDFQENWVRCDSLTDSAAIQMGRGTEL